MKLNNTYYILRHGESKGNVENIVSCWPEKFHNFLTEKGKEQIRAAAEKLENKNIDLIFCSPLLRAKETAGIVGKKLNIKPKIDKRLRELGFGIFNGKPVEDFERHFANHADRIINKPPKGENYQDVTKRMFEFFKNINKKYKGKNILIVSHQAPLLLLRAKVNGHLLSESIESLEKIFQEKRITKGELIELNENKTL
ncbi:MAG: histidine phosphatase family protein [Candidatus Staskawiczbacteria bacterium]|nr:histidine phosphatase family protein [Candidatus Staskawiczbacteria bacterium]